MQSSQDYWPILYKWKSLYMPDLASPTLRVSLVWDGDDGEDWSSLPDWRAFEVSWVCPMWENYWCWLGRDIDRSPFYNGHQLIYLRQIQEYNKHKATVSLQKYPLYVVSIIPYDKKSPLQPPLPHPLSHLPPPSFERWMWQHTRSVKPCLLSLPDFLRYKRTNNKISGKWYQA